MSTMLRGVIPAVVTPLDSGERFAAKPMEKLLERLYWAGSDGVYVCGQTGEGLLLSKENRQRAAETAVRNSPRGKQVIVHVGTASTADAVELSRHAGHIGAHGVSSLPPSNAFTFPEVRAYYEAIAAAADLPVLVYYFPEFSRSVSTLDEINSLCSIPNVVGLKFTDFDFYRLSLISRAGHVIFSGRDEAFACGVLMGASGGIGSFFNLVPEMFVQVWQAGLGGDFATARRVQDRINDLIRVVLQFPMLPAIKTLLTWSGIECGPAVAPRRALTDEEERHLRDEVKAIGFEPEGFLSARSVTTA
jgi:N-acetylneuraminate lyase